MNGICIDLMQMSPRRDEESGRGLEYFLVSLATRRISCSELAMMHQIYLLTGADSSKARERETTHGSATNEK